jgi:hypothetical protein
MYEPRAQGPLRGGDDSWMSDTIKKWRGHVSRWRASGETAEAFSKRQGLVVGTLRYWSSRLRRLAVEDDKPKVPELRVARLVRTPAPRVLPASRTIEIELQDVEARIIVDTAIDRDVLAMVIDVVGFRRRTS